MRITNDMMRLYAVTDRAWTGKQSLSEQVESAIIGGVTCVQLRDKNPGDNIKTEALKIKDICRKYRVPFIVNDNVYLAAEIGADGVHIGQKDTALREARKILGDGAIIGVSARTVEQALTAEGCGADYLGVGAVFATSTKLDASNISYDTLRSICKSVNIPVVAIGGINKNNILSLTGSGADGVALVSAIFAADDIESECKELRRLSDMMVQGENI